MKYRNFEQSLLPFKVFSIEDIRKKDPDFDSRRLVEWQQKKYLEKIINRWYIFSAIPLNERLLFLMANKMYAPSYISLESALAWHGLIPEGVFSTYSVTSKKTKTFHTPKGTFFYRHLKANLHFGYRLEPVDNQNFKIAEPEKAILDYLYLHPNMKTALDFEAWRINPEWLNNHLDEQKLMNYLSLFANKALAKRVNSLLKYKDGRLERT